MSKTYEEGIFKVVFKTTGMENYGVIPWLEQAMENELMRVYSIYAEMANDGVTESLNNEFYRRYPEYFKRNRDKEWYELTLYNQFMANGYNRMICDKLNESNISELLEFYVADEEVNLMGRLKVDPKVTIEFFLKEVN